MALKRGGIAIDDPKAWWDALPDDVVTFWEAYWKVEPWGCEWDRHSQMMSLLDAIYAATINQHLTKENMHKPSMPDQYMPGDYLKDTPRVTEKSVDIVAQLDAVAARLKLK